MIGQLLLDGGAEQWVLPLKAKVATVQEKLHSLVLKTKQSSSLKWKLFWMVSTEFPLTSMTYRDS